MTRTLSQTRIESSAAAVAGMVERIAAGTPPLPRTILLAAHPDDETVSAGSRLCCFDHLWILHATDGAPSDMRDAHAYGFTRREDYAAARGLELDAALGLSGPSAHRRMIGFVDQSASLHLVTLARWLALEIRAARAELILTHPYEGGHPDHDACSFAAHAAGAITGTPVAEFASYHAAPQGIAALDFLPSRRPVFTAALTPEESAAKQRMIDCFTSQRTTLAMFPLDVERYRPAPEYDFTAPPHEGKLLYENFPWGMTGEEFRHLARQAIGRLRT